MSSPSGVDHAVIGGVVAVIVFILLCLLIIFGRYLIRHKGRLLAPLSTPLRTRMHSWVRFKIHPHKHWYSYIGTNYTNHTCPHTTAQLLTVIIYCCPLMCWQNIFTYNTCKIVDNRDMSQLHTPGQTLSHETLWFRDSHVRLRMMSEKQQSSWVPPGPNQIGDQLLINSVHPLLQKMLYCYGISFIVLAYQQSQGEL